VNISLQEFEWYTRQVQVLKENVKDMLMASKKDTVEHIEFSITLKLNLKPFSTSQMSLHVFHQKQNKKFSSLLKTSNL
jgi:hypothetical protein